MTVRRKKSMEERDEPLIKLTGLSKDYIKGSRVISALQNISMEVKRGDFVAIMGPSGAGKSTLLYLLGCLDRPTSGFYRLDGKEVSALSDRELSAIRAARIGFIFQTFNLLPRYSVLDNVQIPFLYRDTPPDEAKALAREAVRSVGLEDRANHSPAELSGGELQRAAIARALAVEPALLLADEPTGNLDTRTGEEILALFEKLNDQGKTILMVTHNPDIAGAARRTIHLRDGKLVEEENVKA